MARDFEDHCWKDVFSPEEFEVYRAYHRDLHVGERPALLAIDLYNFVYRGGSHPPHELAARYPNACGEYAWNAIEPTQKLFAAARAAGLPVLYTTGVISRNRVRSTKRQAGLDMVENDYEIHDAFRPEPDDIVIRKERASGFFGTPLIAHLTRLGVGSLIICGESTSGCVRASTVDAYSNGFHCVVVEECVFDRSILTHKVNLFDMHNKYADVMGLDEVTAHLEKMTS